MGVIHANNAKYVQYMPPSRHIIDLLGYRSTLRACVLELVPRAPGPKNRCHISPNPIKFYVRLADPRPGSPSLPLKTSHSLTCICLVGSPRHNLYSTRYSTATKPQTLSTTREVEFCETPLWLRASQGPPCCTYLPTYPFVHLFHVVLLRVVLAVLKLGER